MHKQLNLDIEEAIFLKKALKRHLQESEDVIRDTKDDQKSCEPRMSAAAAEGLIDLAETNQKCIQSMLSKLDL